MRIESNPWHHHNPAFLSGVYYLKIPGDGTVGGTEFHDPRTAPALGTRNQSVEPVENSWVIFPGWLQHRSNYVDTEEPRYVIACQFLCESKMKRAILTYYNDEIDKNLLYYQQKVSREV
jgi:hypothetical protein